MKKTALVLLSALTMATAVKAQDDRLKPVEGTWGVGFSLNGLANISVGNWQTTGLESVVINDQLGVLPNGTTVGNLVPQELLFGRYYLTDKSALRFAFGLNSNSSKTTREDSSQSVLISSTEKFSVFSVGLGLGYEHHCSDNSRRIDPYVGGQLNFGMIGPMNHNYDQTISGSPETFTTVDTKWKGGTSFSLDGIIGVNVFIAKNFALGAESNIGWGTMALGGEYTRDSRTTVGNSTFTSNERGVYKNRMSGFRVGSASSIRLAFYF